MGTVEMVDEVGGAPLNAEAPSGGVALGLGGFGLVFPSATAGAWVSQLSLLVGSGLGHLHFLPGAGAGVDSTGLVKLLEDLFVAVDVVGLNQVGMSWELFDALGPFFPGYAQKAQVVEDLLHGAGLDAGEVKVFDT